MEKHPQYLEIADHIRRFPKQGPYLFQTYLDLLVGRRWPRIQVVDADEIDKAFLIGEREPNGEIHILLPMSIDDFASPSDLSSWFRHIPQRKFSSESRTFPPPVFAKAQETGTASDTRQTIPISESVVRPVQGDALEPGPASGPQTPNEAASAAKDAKGKPAPESIVLAVCDHSSTVVYYRMYDGIVPPKT